MEVIKSELSFKDGWTLDKQGKQRACGKGVWEQRQRWERTGASGDQAVDQCVMSWGWEEVNLEGSRA